MIPLVFEDKQKCFYLLSVSKRQLLPINELMFLILKYYFEFGNLIIKSDWMNKYDNSFVKKTVEKFLFFRDHHYLDPITVKVDAKINFNNIERPLSNINQICFELTQKCNLSCTYCCYGDLYDHIGNDNNSELNEETALCFLDNLRENLSVQKNELSHRKITIGFYGGEALLKIDVIKRLIHYIDENIKNIPNIFINYIVTTNGLLLDKYIDFLVDENLLVNNVNSNLCSIANIREFRPATDSEKQLLFDALAKEGKTWDAQKKQVVDLPRWRAEKGEGYCMVIVSPSEVKIFEHEKTDCHSLRESFVLKENQFKTLQSAKKVAEQIREIFKTSKAE